MGRSRLFPVAIPLFFLMSVPSARAQGEFERSYGGSDKDLGMSVRQTTDGGYIIGGSTRSYGRGLEDVYLIKTDAEGDTLWTRTYGGPSIDIGECVRQTSDGGYIVAGHTISFGAGTDDIYLIRTDADGDSLWARTYGGPLSEKGRSVEQTTDGGYIVVGSTTSIGAGSADVYLIKTDADGDTLWTRTYGGPFGDEGFSVEPTSDDGYIIAGTSISFGIGSNHVYLVKTDAVGDTLWTRTYGNENLNEGHSVRQTRDGGYIVAGNISNPQTIFDVFLVKTDTMGNTLWTRSWGGPSNDEGRSVCQTPDGGYIVAGFTESIVPGKEVAYLIRTDASGDTLWTRTFGDTAENASQSVQVTAGGGIVVVGHTTPPATNEDVYLIRIDGRGPIPTSAEALDRENSIPGIDEDDQVVIAFDEETNRPAIDAGNIDQVLELSGGHIWRDEFGNIGDAIWNQTGDRLLITLSTTLGPPTVAVGDTITPDGWTITDLAGNPAFLPVVLSGSFDPPVGIGGENEAILGPPKALSLSQNYPNPFNPSTTISFSIPEHGGGIVTLRISDVRGRQIKTLVEREFHPGHYTVHWDGRNDGGEPMPSGLYLYSLRVGELSVTRKLVMTR
jgi:hypothetical protein